jgi:hypothetical protein
MLRPHLVLSCTSKYNDYVVALRSINLQNTMTGSTKLKSHQRVGIVLIVLVHKKTIE